MATAWAEVVSAAMVQIDDIRLQDQLAAAPAQFYRRMAALIQQAQPLMARPPELIAYLKTGAVAPTWFASEWTSTEESMNQQTVLDLGAVGYDLCSVVKVVTVSGAAEYIPYPAATYDKENGTVTFPVQDAAGVEYVMDFYTDGQFPDLTATQMRLFALAVAVVWDERFSRTWLNMQPTIHDDSYTKVNEANYTEKITKRLHDNRISFNDELRAYEQACAYENTMNNSYIQHTVLI